MEVCNIALYGAGTVGGGVVSLLLGRRGALPAGPIGRLRLRYVVDKRVDEVRRGLDIPDTITVTDELERPLRDPEVGVVVELLGGRDAAAQVTEGALRAGKHVVTANKALLAARGGEFFRVARENGCCVAFEASVGGGIPIISAVREAMAAERIESVYGIVNGTCNYILTCMSERGLSYDEALAEAQQKGYAEADPSLDVEGADSAHKLAILARLAFHADVREDDIYCEGITGIETQDLCYAHSMGYCVKLLATGIRRGEQIALRVHPALLRHEHPLSAVSGAYNAVCVHGAAVGEVVLTGLGAGRWPTASAVVADICRVALGTYQREFAQLRPFGDLPRAQVVPMERAEMRYYFRLSCLDRPGVLAQVSGVLGRHGISIASCIQQDQAPRDGYVPVVFMTHQAREGPLREALNEIDMLPCIDGSRTQMLRVQEI